MPGAGLAAWVARAVPAVPVGLEVWVGMPPAAVRAAATPCRARTARIVFFITLGIPPHDESLLAVAATACLFETPALETLLGAHSSTFDHALVATPAFDEVAVAVIENFRLYHRVPLFFANCFSIVGHARRFAGVSGMCLALTTPGLNHPMSGWQSSARGSPIASTS